MLTRNCLSLLLWVLFDGGLLTPLQPQPRQTLTTEPRENVLRLPGRRLHFQRVKRGWVWNQFFVLEEYMGAEPQYVGKAMLQPHHPSSSSCQNRVSKFSHSSAEHFLKREDSSQVKITTENGLDWESLSNPAMIDRGLRSQAYVKHALPDPESSEKSLQSTKVQNQAQKMPKESLSSLPTCQKGLLQDISQIAPTDMGSPALASVENKEAVNVNERKDELEEEELQELLTKLMDTFNLEMPSGPQSSVNMDLYGGAEWVCRAFSALVDQITLPSLK